MGPLVSVICTVYNHEAFLRDCLNGFVMQKTNFPFEVLIHEDASTDKSAAIIREYEEQYPDIIYPIYQAENQYSKGVKIWANIMFPKARGKYIALCEGDDYWTNSLKLQKQVDYMETHPECALCVHNAIEHWDDNSKKDGLFSQLEDRDYSGVEVCQKWILPTASFLFRSDCSQAYIDVLNKCKTKMTFSDTVLAVSCATKGTIHALVDTMSVYRRNNSSFTLSHNPYKYYRTGESWEQFIELFGNEYRCAAVDQSTYNYLMGLLYSMKNKDMKLAARCFYKGILCHPFYGVKKSITLLREKITNS